MGFKANESFLRFLTMGAVGVRSAISHLRTAGFEPVELERYCTKNKIWATKVKRLRLPDLLCVRTGLRVEVRAKSDLKIRMSDAPNNPDRRWDAGLRNDDVVAFVPCGSEEDRVVAKGPPTQFLVRDLRSTVGNTTLGPPKSASEGAERDREWKSTVPTQSGEVLEVSNDRIRTHLASGRMQTYRLRGKTAYVNEGDEFVGGVSVIAAAVPRLAPLSAARTRRWNPLEALAAPDEVDRYAAAKALPHRSDYAARSRDALLNRAAGEVDDRVALEMAASAARLGHPDGLERIEDAARLHEREDLRMEAVLILSELGTDEAAGALKSIATSREFSASELRQAAVWGLGRGGCRAFAHLVELLGDEEDEVVLHAIAAFDTATPVSVLTDLVNLVRVGSARERAAASEALRFVGSETAIHELARASRDHATERAWILATLGRFESFRVRSTLAGDPLLSDLEPLLLLGPTENWLASRGVLSELSFLLRQDLP